MKKFLVIGNPIKHSLSPELHNYWLKKNNIDAIYEKRKLENFELKNIILEIKKKKIEGVNITVPFKKEVISHLDNLSLEAKKTQSVNTIYLEDNNLIGHNTDTAGFELSLKEINYNVRNKKILILGAGGVVSSIIFALYKMKALKITIVNRTKKKAENLKNLFKDLEIKDWKHEFEFDFDMIINATSVGLNQKDQLDFNFSKIGNNKFFYDVIYNPSETNFIKTGKSLGNKTENGKMMFIYQASQAFNLWHKLMPEIDEETIRIVNND